MKPKKADYWIEKLNLVAHPEGGYFREIYRSNELIPLACLPERFNGPRCFGTSIYFLLKSDTFSALHRIKSDEIWHFYLGTPLKIYAINPNGRLSNIILGQNVDAGESFQAVVPAGAWFGAKVTRPDSFALVGCTVAPGFDFDDFEMGERNNLLSQFPHHREIIEMLTR